MTGELFTRLGKRPLRNLIEDLAREQGVAAADLSWPRGKTKFSNRRHCLMYDELLGCNVRRFREAALVAASWGVELEINDRDCCGLTVSFSEFTSVDPKSGARTKKFSVKLLPIAAKREDYFLNAALAA